MSPFILPYKEYRRLHDRAYRAQQKGHIEVCGIVLCSAKRHFQLIFLKNRSTKPYSYEVDLMEIRKLEQCIPSRMKIVATFHSHPIGYAKPSKGDLRKGFYRNCELIYDVCGRDAKLWRRFKSQGKKTRTGELPLLVERTKKKRKAIF